MAATVNAEMAMANNENPTLHSILNNASPSFLMGLAFCAAAERHENMCLNA